MAKPEIALDVEHLEEEKTQRLVVDQHSKLETTRIAKSASTKDGGDTKTIRKWSTINKTLNGDPQFLPTWNNIFVISCVFAVCFDPLFFYIPIIHEEMKCLKFDTKLQVIAVVLRLFADHFYIADIIVRILSGILKTNLAAASGVAKTLGEAPDSKAKKSAMYVLAMVKRVWAKTNRSYILIDILAILPIPQVGIFVFFPRNWKGGKLLDTLVFFQYIPRVLPVYLLCKERQKALNKLGMWTRGVFNFFLYILASHVIGALWYFYSIQREMDCWNSVCRANGYQCSPFGCNEQGYRSRVLLAMLNKSCFLNKSRDPNKSNTIFEFGMYANALESGIVKSTDFPRKLLYCFWWGLRNLSSFGQNLNETSTYAWENLFAVFICIISLLLVIYLIGSLQTYWQFSITRSEKLRRKMKRKNLEVDLWLSRKGLPNNLKEVIMQIIQQKLEQNKDVNVENILFILPPAHSKYIKRYLRLAILKKVPMLQNIGVKVLKEIGEHLEMVDFAEDTCVIKEGDKLDKMLFITHGTVQIYKTNGKGGKIGCEFLEKGDFYGSDKLLIWASKFGSGNELQISMRMVKTVTKVEAFALSAVDLKSVVIKYWWHFTKNKELKDFNESMLEEFAESSIEKEIRRRKQGKKKHSSESLNKLDNNQGSSVGKKLQRVISEVMSNQLPPTVGALKV